MSAYLMDTELERTAAELISDERLRQRLDLICSFHRDKGSAGLWQAVEAIAERCSGLPFTRIKVHSYPSDGVLSYGTWRSPCSWELKCGEVVLITGGERQIPLVRKGETNFGIFSYSGSCRDKMRLLSLEELTRLQQVDHKEQLDKVVFVRAPHERAFRHLIIPRFVAGMAYAPTSPDRRNDPILKNARLWRRMLLTGAENFDDSKTIPFGISLTPAQGDLIESVLKEDESLGKSSHLQVDIDSRFGAGSFPVLELVIEGHRRPKEYIIVCAHVCHPGPSANDNASGVAAAVELASLISQVFERGGLRKTERGLIVLLVPEMVGSLAWLLDERRTQYKILAGINLDMIATDPQPSNSKVYLTRPPLTIQSLLPWLGSHYLDRVEDLDRLINAGVFGAEAPFAFESVGFSMGSDNHAFVDPDFGIPMISFGCWPDKFYHSDADIPDRLSLYQLKRLTWVTACIILDLLAADSRSGKKIIRERAKKLLRDRRSGTLDSRELVRFYREASRSGDLYPTITLDEDPLWRSIQGLALQKAGDLEFPTASSVYRGEAAMIPQRRYRGPIARNAVFAISKGRAVSNLENLVDDQRIQELTALAHADMLLDGKACIGEIVARLADGGVEISTKLLAETMEQLAAWGLIEIR